MSQRAMIPNPQPGDSSAPFNGFVLPISKHWFYEEAKNPACYLQVVNTGGNYAVSWCSNDLKYEHR